MSFATQPGSPQFPTISGKVEASTRDAMDAAVRTLQSHKDAWVALPVRERIALIDEMMQDIAPLAPDWVAACNQEKGISDDASLSGEEWTLSPLPVLTNLRQLRQSLSDIDTYGRPRIPGKIKTRPDGQVIAPVFPLTIYDRIFFGGLTAEIWMEPGVAAETLPETQAVIYHDKQHSGKVNLVLGAGNVSSIGPLDVLYKLFVEDQVVVLKMNPVNAYTGPYIEQGMQALIKRGFLRVVYGGAAEGAYLCNHPGVEEIHITGSDKTFDAIVFGGGTEGAARKAGGKPQINKLVTGELGNVSPVIVVPGPWTAADITYQAEHIATMLTTNAGFNCNATRMIIQHAGWNQREELLQAIRKVLGRVPPRDAYYPGAQQRQQLFLASHPEAEQIGNASEQQLPWTLISGVDPAHEDDVCFTTEAFCGLFAETTLAADSVADYIDRAVAFANDELWGTLVATLLVHPASLKEPAIAEAMERATANLRYGSVGINYWGGVSFSLGPTTWGAFPGHSIDDIQSGVGVVHNTLMFSRPQKSVLRGPFRSIPTPPWFATHRKASMNVFPRLTEFEADPSPWKVPGIVWAALNG